MKAHPHCLASVALATLFCAAIQGAVLNFDDLPVPQHNDFLNLFGETPTPYGGVTFSLAAVAGDHLVAHSQHASDYWITPGTTGPFLQPHSGHVALFNPAGLKLDFATEQILTGLWVARPNLGPTGVGGAEDLTLTAYSGDTPLATLTIHLLSTTPVFWDTSALLRLSGITRYTISPAEPGRDTGYFVADDFQFTSRPLAAACPCEDPGRSHAQYVRCVRGVLGALVKEDSLTKRQARDLLREASRSDCGQRNRGSK